MQQNPFLVIEKDGEFFFSLRAAKIEADKKALPTGAGRAGN
jgi:hypothetical protein